MEKLEQNKIFLRHLIADGIAKASPIAPCQALKSIMTTPEIIPFKYSEDERHDIYRILVLDYPVLENFYHKKIIGLNESLTQDEQDNLKGLLQWLMQDLRIWSEAEDIHAKRLSLIFITANILIENLWELIPPNSIYNIKLNEFLAGRFERFKCTIEIPQDSQVPIWEKEATQQYMDAIKEKDWQHLANKWHILGSSPKLDQANTFQNQIFLFLLSYSPEQLISATERYEDFISLMLICKEHSFSLIQRFQIALDTISELFRFSLLFSLELNNNQYDDLTDAEAEIFAQIFQKIARNPEQQSQWLLIFNCYLTRFAIFATGFGVYLAKYTSEIDFDLYLNAIKIDAINPQHGYESTRPISSITFQKFAEVADINRRKLLWSKCYHKWLEWDFGRAEQQYYYLGAVHLTNFDYALAGYFFECKNQEDREAFIQSILKDIDSIFIKQWYASQSDISTEFYNLLSKLQPVCHADNLNKDGQIPCLMKPERFYSSNTFQIDERYNMAFHLT
ncbi:MAG: hypothetical protein WA154_10420 [Moraxellaceae bacterium]